MELGALGAPGVRGLGPEEHRKDCRIWVASPPDCCFWETCLKRVGGWVGRSVGQGWEEGAGAKHRAGPSRGV